eukprot:2145870-Pyramimonas_sp.AAC.1
MGFALGKAAGWASQPVSHLVAELAAGLWWSALALLLSIHSLCGRLLTWRNILVQWVCAEECA